jgi:hypothetical protein
MRASTILFALALVAATAWSGCDKGGDDGGPAADTLAADTGCVPACEGKQCGDDGCGDTCGACGDEETCTLGVCVVPQPGPICGDDLCEAPEGPEDCPEDCAGEGPVCGDDLCTPPELPETCPDDCGPPGGNCGDGDCVPPETPETCPGDCEPVDPPEGCTTDADCSGSPPCPPPSDAPQGCVCVDKPEGGVCLPACVTDDDCPELVDVTLTCLPEGFCGIGSTEPVCGDDLCSPPETLDSCPEDCSGVDPQGCGTDADCEGTPPCPPASEAPKGCVCVEGPDVNVCVPACDTPADCPSPPGQEMICDVNGVCAVPDTGPPGCTSDADCASTPPCPPPSDAPMGCTCVEGPDVNFCAIACVVDGDCTSPPGAVFVCKDPGYCGPQ